jgi:hypothetical protein
MRWPHVTLLATRPLSGGLGRKPVQSHDLFGLSFLDPADRKQKYDGIDRRGDLPAEQPTSSGHASSADKKARQRANHVDNNVSNDATSAAIQQLATHLAASQIETNQTNSMSSAPSQLRGTDTFRICATPPAPLRSLSSIPCALRCASSKLHPRET